MAAGSRSIRQVLVATSLAALGVLVLLELSARLFLFGLDGLHPGKMDSIGRLWQMGIVRASPDPELGYELEPNLNTYFKLARFETNSKGLRDREYPLEKPANTFRVAVVGASFAMPSGVEIEAAFHSILEQRLTAESRSLRYEFINFAVGTYGPRQCLAMLRLRALDYAPDLIVFSVSKLSMPLLDSRWDKPLPARKDLKRQHSFHESFLRKLLELRVGGKWIGTWAPETPNRPDRIPSVLAKLGDFSRATGIPVLVSRLEYNATPPSELDLAIAAQVRANGLLFVDTRDSFAATTPSDFWIYELDPHPNAAAHAIFADVIAVFLRENRLIPRGPL